MPLPADVATSRRRRRRAREAEETSCRCCGLSCTRSLLLIALVATALLLAFIISDRDAAALMNLYLQSESEVAHSAGTFRASTSAAATWMTTSVVQTTTPVTQATTPVARTTTPGAQTVQPTQPAPTTSEEGPVMQVTDGSGRLGNNLAFVLRGLLFAKVTKHAAVKLSFSSKSLKELFSAQAMLPLTTSLESKLFCPEKSDKRQEGRPMYNFQGERCKGVSAKARSDGLEHLPQRRVPAGQSARRPLPSPPPPVRAVGPMAMAAAPLAAAADLVRQAEALLICTGAGMGVDSGLGTFRGRNAGVWPPLKAMSMDFQEMSSPSWFDSDPRLAWAFWRFRHQAYTQGAPHQGYSLLSQWGNAMKHGLFSVTSNIDGHWDRTEGVGPGKVYECHGALTRLQCVEDDGSIWPTEAEKVSDIQVPDWDLQPGEEDGLEVVAKVQEDGASLADASGRVVRAKALKRSGGVDLLRALEGSPLPRSHGGKPARPNVLMFGDYGVNCRIIREQRGRFEAWQRQLPPEAKLVIVEVGAGKAVPTIRSTSETTLRKFPQASLVRINWDDSDVNGYIASRAVSVGGVGALDALTEIDRLMKSSEPASECGPCCSS
ncbi:unnamed protein product [Effrenium voratum]|uniref:Deacetylase sirtuin-type domain-containing protein n=1 Tax=Effrenium voratum TaxID=2562239 RepID=A0AA36MS02_9DINO|nr:unnamed protein product [Effrenium voratum]